MKLELQKVKLGPGSEETIQFTGELFIDGIRAAFCSDAGRGGEIDITPINYTDANRKLIIQAENYCKTLPSVPSSFGGKPLEMDLQFWLSMEVGKIEQKKESNRVINQIKRLCKNSIIIISKKEYDDFMDGKTLTLPYNQFKLKNNISTYSTETLKKAVDRIKENTLKNDEFILNNNLPN